MLVTKIDLCNALATFTSLILAGDAKCSPHLLVVGVSNSCDPVPAGMGRRLSGEHSGGCAARSERRSRGAAASIGVLLNTARSDGIDLRKG